MCGDNGMKKKKDFDYVSLNEAQKAKFDGTTVGKDKDGYFCFTHRCRSISYPTVDKIPKGRIKFIESTGQKVSMKYVAKAWWIGRKFKHPETGNMVLFKSLPLDMQRQLNKQFQTTIKKEKGKGKQPSLPFDRNKQKQLFDLLKIKDVREIGKNKKLVKGLGDILKRYNMGDYAGYGVVDRGNVLIGFGGRGVIYFKPDWGKLKPVTSHKIDYERKDANPAIRKFIKEKSPSGAKYAGHYYDTVNNRLFLYYDNEGITIDTEKGKAVSSYMIIRPGAKVPAPKPKRKTVEQHIDNSSVIKDVISFLDTRATGEATEGKRLRDKLKKQLGNNFSKVLLHFGDPDNPAHGDVRLKWFQHLEELRQKK